MSCLLLSRFLRSVRLTVLAAVCAPHAAQAQSMLYAESPFFGASRGLLGDPGNSTFQITTPPYEPGAITHIRFTGRLSVSNPQTYASEACIEVTTPDGSKFVVQPFTTGTLSSPTWTPEPGITLAMGNGVGGTYTFRLFELYRDEAAGADAYWNDIFVAFWTGQPFDNTITPTATGPSVAAANWGDVRAADSARPLAFSPAGPLAAGSVRVKGYGTALTGWTVSNSASPQSFVRINFTATSAIGGGQVSWSVTPMPGASFSSTEFDLTVNTPQPVLCDAAHPWSYTVTAPGVPASVRPQIANVKFNVQPLQMNPPPAMDLGTVYGRPLAGPSGTTVVASASATHGAGTVSWYRFTTPEACSPASGKWLDIHTRQPAGSAIDDHEIAVYNADSTRLAEDDDSGAGRKSMLSFGATSPVRPNIDADPSPVARAGQNGVLPVGTYYLAVAEYNALFATPGFGAGTSSTGIGAIAVDFRTNMRSAPAPAASDFGQLPLEAFLAGSAAINTPSQIVWVRFDLMAPVTTANGRYLDIHTVGNASPAVVDTEIGLFGSAGQLIAADDDDGGNGNRSLLTFGAGAHRSAIQFEGSFSRNGRDGELQPGTYFLAVGVYNMTFNESDVWSVTSNNTATVESVPLTIVTGSPCPADLGVQGGGAGHDGVLDNNDFIAFISLFFALDPQADVGVQGGGPGSDGVFDNNDFIAFISHFFNGCP